MSHRSLPSKSIPMSPSFISSDVLRDLVAAMPIVILAKALREALQQRRTATRN